MTKLEELTELLVNEINEFNKGIEKLEAINKEISITKIQMDLTEYKVIIEQHQQKMSQQINAQETFESRFNDKLKQAKIYPNWAVIVFIIALLFGFVSTSYVILTKM